jgi:hypothetical protein
MSESPIHLALSAKGLQRIEQVNHENDFAFIVGDERYPCPSFIAELLSPRITSLRSQDITLNEFSIETEETNKYFGNLLSVATGREVSLLENELRFVRSVCGELWNSELFEKTLKEKEGDITEEELRARLDFISGLGGSCSCDIGVVSSHFYELSVSDFDRLSPWVLESILRDPSLVLQDEDSLFEIVYRLACADLSYFVLLEFVRFEFLSEDCMKRAFDFISSSFESLTFGIWSSLRTRLTLPVNPSSQTGRFFLPVIDSTIISAIPKIFSVFGEKQYGLLYRGSRDGFQAANFHAHCNGHPHTITLISSKNSCIFGGYNPLAWSSRGAYVPDPSLMSFLFTIKNPHNLPPQIFKKNGEAYAIYDKSTYGPTFGDHALRICDQCQSSDSNYSRLDNGYVNDTGITRDQVLTGSYNFTVEEIEVFEVI